MNVANWLSSTARHSPAKAALLRGTEIVATYDQFARRAMHLGQVLARRYGLAEGDRVALFMANRTEYLECLYAVWWIGAVVVPINSKLHVNEAAWIVAHSGAKVVFADSNEVETLKAEIGDASEVISVEHRVFSDPVDSVELHDPMGRQSSDLAWIFYTSGTTGRPKGAMLTHGNLLAMSLSYFADVDAVNSGDTAIYAAPLSHGAGLYNFVHVRAAAQHCVPASGGFEADEVLELSKRFGSTSLFAAPTMVRRLVDAAAGSGRGEGLKTLVYGGGPMYLSDIEHALSIFGDKFVQIYGQGESPMTI
ncbi:AMP-binding protein, partial [Rhizobiaceae sp. 2RAB30]